ncbi:hypothetical protein BH10BAC1_BH10BAC1_12960 [soil metagenome]
MILIAASMSLLVIIAGMFLLAKTQKENLSNLFKYVSYFVILSGFLMLFGGGLLFVAKKCMQHVEARTEMDCHKHNKHKKACSRMNMCEQGEGEMCIEKRIVMNGEEMKEECEKNGAKDCCKNKMMKKDSIVLIKK